jgi:hypothetical protein
MWRLGQILVPLIIKDSSSRGYMYNQMLEYDPSTQEMKLKLRALNESVNYENFFLHFTEDTEFIVSDLTLSSSTSLNGVPWLMGWTSSADHAGFVLYVYVLFSK